MVYSESFWLSCVHIHNSVILILPFSHHRGSNKKALVVAGVTVLATLLIAGQAFTAYSVYKHSEKLSMLERRSDRLQEMTVRARGESAVCEIRRLLS